MKRSGGSLATGGLLLVALGWLTVSGCATWLKLQTDLAVVPMVSEMVSKASDAENLRVVKEGMPTNIVMLTALAKISPDNRRLLKDCAFLYCAYGMMVENEDAEYAAQLYANGRQYGMDALKTDTRFRKGLEAGRPLPELVEYLDEDYAEALSWTGICSGLWILRNMDDVTALVRLVDALALVKRSIELDEDYFFGMGKAFLGAYYAQVPESLGTGGGPAASRKMFAEARAVTDGKLLLVDVYEARFLLSQIKDREGYVATLEKVLEADPDILKGGRAFTAMAKVKARYFLEHRKEYF
ncbi:MAG: TRAP transporter TatT component family protein [Desulfosudaceae bacterium]